MTTATQQIQDLVYLWVQIGTNEGTYGAAEACRKVGSGDPAHANCYIYEQVGTGKRRTDGPKEDRAPGYIRWFTDELTERRNELAELRKQVRRGGSQP